MTLFEIDKAIREFEWEVDEETGEILNFEALDELKLKREEKIEAIGIIYKETKAEAEAIKAEVDALSERLKRNNNRAESLLNYMKYALNGEPFETPRVQAKWRKTSSVEIIDENVIEEKYMKIETKRTPVKKLIKDAIKSGEVVKGARIVESKSLSIK